MKRLLFILIIIVTNCAKQQETNRIIITGKIIGEIPEKIEYTLPIDGINYFGFKNSVIPDFLGIFKIELPVETASFIEFFNEYDSYGVIIAESGMNYSIFINTEEKDNRFYVKSENDQGQNLYNQISNYKYLKNTADFDELGDTYKNDSVLSQIKQDIKEKLGSDIARFKELLDANLISNDFHKLVTTDRSYYYAGVQSSVALLNWSRNQRGNNASLQTKDYENLWESSFQTYPISNPDLIRSTWSYSYISSFLQYKAVIEYYNIENSFKTEKQPLTYKDRINLAKKHLSDHLLEYHNAAYIYEVASNENYEKDLITLFERFKEDYPSSDYTHFVESEIIPIIAFHEKQNETLNKNIHFVVNGENINSLKEAIKNLNANEVYVDVWATWCSPCKVEFKYNKELYELLKTKNITMLYVSIDEDNKNETWKDMIKYYELEGYHIRINEKFYNDLRNLRGRENAFYIPWHFITDGEGNIINMNASGPSEIKKLEKQLSE